MALVPDESDPTGGRRHCYSMEDKTEGFFFSEDPVTYLIRIFPLQLSLVAFFVVILQILLKPFGGTPVVAQILGGLAIGPLGLQNFQTFSQTIMPEGGTFLPDTLGLFGCMIYLFLIGVKMDLNILKRSTKKERVIGFSTFSVPLVINLCLRYVLRKIYPSDDVEFFPFTLIAIMSSTTSFHTIICFLADHKILSTDVGRIATSVSTISGSLSWTTIMISFAWNQHKDSSSPVLISYILSGIGILIFIIVVLGKIVIWMMKQTPQGEPLKDIYLFSIFIMIVGTGFLTELFGHHCLLGPTILGLVIPNGPPIGSTLEMKLDTFIAGVMLPLYFFSVGSSVDISLVETNPCEMIIWNLILGFLGKLIGSIIPCLLNRIPLQDALTLGLILSTLGTFDVQTYFTAKLNGYIDTNSYSIMVISALAISGVISPLIHFIYNPSRRYTVYKNRNIQNVKNHSELRILVCVYSEENVCTMVNILEASNPTMDNPIAIYLLHIVELTGRAAPLLITHKFNDPTITNHIINGFKMFEKQNQGVVSLQAFTSITHFMYAHDDICTIALERRTSFIIIPFHKRWNIDGTAQKCKWENANKRVLKYAPCSAGILIEGRRFESTRSLLSNQSSCKIGLLFLGDSDDREALCYGMRMATHPNVYLTVHRIIVIDIKTYDVNEKMLDGNVINEYRLNYLGNEHAEYKEENVRDTVDIINVIRTVESAYDLILIGRSHPTYYSLLSGYIDWSEYPELGFFGDVFASSEFKDNASILVIQQHSRDLKHDDSHDHFLQHV